MTVWHTKPTAAQNVAWWWDILSLLQAAECIVFTCGCCNTWHLASQPKFAVCHTNRKEMHSHMAAQGKRKWRWLLAQHSHGTRTVLARHSHSTRLRPEQNHFMLRRHSVRSVRMKLALGPGTNFEHQLAHVLKQRFATELSCYRQFKLNSSVFWVTARRKVVWNRRFGATYRSLL